MFQFSPLSSEARRLADSHICNKCKLAIYTQANLGDRIETMRFLIAHTEGLGGEWGDNGRFIPLAHHAR